VVDSLVIKSGGVTVPATVVTVVSTSATTTTTGTP
jgi:hypothetical protein